MADFDFDLLSCTWEDVISELKKAEAAAFDHHVRGNKFHNKIWRGLGRMGERVGPALDAIPDELCVLHGGIAVIFSIGAYDAL